MDIDLTFVHIFCLNWEFLYRRIDVKTGWSYFLAIVPKSWRWAIFISIFKILWTLITMAVYSLNLKNNPTESHRAKKKLVQTLLHYRPVLEKVVRSSLEVWQFSKAVICVEVALGREQFKLKSYLRAQRVLQTVSAVSGFRARLLFFIVWLWRNTGEQLAKLDVLSWV